ERQRDVALVRIPIQVLDALGGERRSAAHDAVHGVALREQQLGEIRTVLAGHAGDQRGLAIVRGHRNRLYANLTRNPAAASLISARIRSRSRRANSSSGAAAFSSCTTPFSFMRPRISSIT